MTCNTIVFSRRNRIHSLGGAGRTGEYIVDIQIFSDRVRLQLWNESPQAAPALHGTYIHSVFSAYFESAFLKIVLFFVSV